MGSYSSRMCACRTRPWRRVTRRVTAPSGAHVPRASLVAVKPRWAPIHELLETPISRRLGAYEGAPCSSIANGTGAPATRRSPSRRLRAGAEGACHGSDVGRVVPECPHVRGAAVRVLEFQAGVDARGGRAQVGIRGGEKLHGIRRTPLPMIVLWRTTVPPKNALTPQTGSRLPAPARQAVQGPRPDHGQGSDRAGARSRSTSTRSDHSAEELYERLSRYDEGPWRKHARSRQAAAPPAVLNVAASRSRRFSPFPPPSAEQRYAFRSESEPCGDHEPVP